MRADVRAIAGPVVAAELRRMADNGVSVDNRGALFHEDDLRARADEIERQQP